MSAPPPLSPGRVWAHVGQPFAPSPYDVAVVGAGRMGAAAALFLRQRAPALRVLLVEEGGLPNEEGATILAPGVWSRLGLDPALHPAADWTRAALQALGDVGWESRPLVTLHAGAAPGRVPTLEALAPWPDSLALVDPAALPWAELDRDAATYRPGHAALHAAQAAIRAGADLLLNTRAAPQPGGRLCLERLTVTNTHQIVTHETLTVPARAVVLAAGAGGPWLAECALGVHTRHARAYRQTPHLAVPSTAQSPVLRAGGLTLRPQHGAYTLIPPLHGRDPHGYQPAGGQLTGVPTGLRRETLEDLVALMDALPVLATDALHLGRSLADVPGAWLALPGGRPEGLPTFEVLDEHTWLLLGGPQADTLGLHAAQGLAEAVAAALA
ncbi:FAD-dependent oxidoreductase [Deinococcus multiflagellatus]|uniref:FAD-dependent oxidoreductase n=1 Tax=Deinococcus multiflagellatus TaxID=1656887 RepID=UPI001CCAB243|nr:FAD-dependent oxidoreductase [Deinococcus multiflagellatus]MBZ9714150.1 FAD-dependent oxidoreductase [Deinococcus multiflagellatus]